MLRKAERRELTAAVVTVAILGVGTTLAMVARPWVAGPSLLEKALFLLPGLLLVRAAAGPGAGWLPVAAFGPFIGFGFSSMALLGLWLAGGRGIWMLIAAPAIVLTFVPFARRLEGRWHSPITRPGDRAALAAVVLVVTLVVGAPFAHVGETIQVGKAYRAYFTADYVWRRTVVAELAKGDVLPRNPFYVDDRLHYYWLPHLSTAVAYRNGRADLDELLLIHSTIIDVCFAAFLFGLARWFVRAPVASALGVITVILCSSYEGLYAIWEIWDNGAPMDLLRGVNVDAITRWRLGGMPIDGLQRVLFYQPHHAVGYGLGFLGVLSVVGRVRRFDPVALAVGGGLLGLSTLISSFAGLMLTTVAAFWEACSVLRWRDWWRASAHFAAAALPLALAAALVTALQYVDTGGSIITVGANRIAFQRVWESTVLSFGPTLLIVAVAAWALLRARDGNGLVFAALWVTCAFFYFWVDIRDHQDVYVGWRVGHLWFIASSALAAVAYQGLSALAERWRGMSRAVVFVAVLGALPTSVIDIYNTQDVYNWAQGPGFPWTLVLAPEEQEALAWVKANTPPDAVLQTDALERGVEGWAYLPAFAERRMGVGLPISMVPLRKYQDGIREAAWIFETSSVATAHAIAARNGIQYLYLGTPERRRHPSALARFDGAPGFFEPVFRNREATIYRVK